ncbi:hypothetical protein D9M71_648730 [compost metagenome]
MKCDAGRAGLTGKVHRRAQTLHCLCTLIQITGAEVVLTPPPTSMNRQGDLILLGKLTDLPGQRLSSIVAQGPEHSFGVFTDFELDRLEVPGQVGDRAKNVRGVVVYICGKGDLREIRTDRAIDVIQGLFRGHCACPWVLNNGWEMAALKAFRLSSAPQASNT